MQSACHWSELSIENSLYHYYNEQKELFSQALYWDSFRNHDNRMGQIFPKKLDGFMRTPLLVGEMGAISKKKQAGEKCPKSDKKKIKFIFQLVII